MSVEFMVGVDEPPRKRHSIYTDLVNLPDPVELGLTVRIFNYDSVTLYMKVDGYASDWTFTENDLGSLASGANVYKNLDDFGSRVKPASETVESVTVRLRAYTDSGYTDLKWTYERSIVMVFIKTDDGSWTTDLLNNFDDGTVQGWASQLIGGIGSAVTEIKSDYVLSVPYSCRMRLYAHYPSPSGNTWLHGLYIWRDAVEILHLGRAYRAFAEGNYVPQDKWMRLVVPLPADEVFELGIVTDWAYCHEYTWSRQFKGRLYKSITTPSVSEIYAIINVRPRSYRTGSFDYHGVTQIDDFLIIYR